MSAQEAARRSPVRVYYSYAPSERDEGLRRELERHLKMLELSGRISGWHRGEIRAGSVYAQERTAQLERAQVILLLISPDFLASQEAYGIEMKHALERQARGEAVVIPILLRSVFYEGAPFAHLEMLPDNGEPITSWSNRDKAFENVVRGINRRLDDLAGGQAQSTSGPREQIIQTPASESVKSCDILLVTATQVETRALLDACQQETGQAFTRAFVGENVYYDLQTIGGARTLLVQSEMGAGGPAGAMLTVEEGIRVLSPSAVFLVGIAYGMQVKGQRMGDILVSRQLMNYELQRVGKDHVLMPRGDRPQAAPHLLMRVRSGLMDWQGPPVHVGLLLSGDKLIDNLDFREQLRQFEPEAIGGEMEGAGIYAVAQRRRVDWIVIKAICDWADGKKGNQQNQRQTTAAENAARFMLHVLRQGGWRS